jgi:HTH-type transcriptional regulator/antitoxin HipB
MDNRLDGACATQPNFDTSGLLRRARRIADLSQRDLAARAAVSPSTVARAELPGCAVSFETVIRLFTAAGMRLTVCDSGGTEIAPMRDDGIRDSTGRRYPAHLDPEPMIRNGWLYGPMSRGGRPKPVAAAERRPDRDRRRRVDGIPDDHPGPESLRRPPPRPPRPGYVPPPPCECGIECERECVPGCECQCEPWRPDLDRPGGRAA